MIMKKFLLICGVSGVGKSFVEDELVRNNHPKISFFKLPQVTTRDKRDDNDPYQFLSKKEYKNIESNLIAKTNFHGNLYGTLDISRIKDYEGKLLINTIIVNAEGFQSSVDDLTKKYGDNFDLFTLRLINDSPVEREGRDQDSLDLENKALESISDATLKNQKGEWADPQDVIQTLFEKEFIYELESVSI